jgi:hypothetical protein
MCGVSNKKTGQRVFIIPRIIESENMKFDDTMQRVAVWKPVTYVAITAL